MSQFFVEGTGGGGGGGVTTITGNTGGPLSSSNINIITANSSVIFAGSGSTETLDFGGTNLLLGNNGSHLTSGIGNVCYGKGAGAALTSGQSNTFIGFDAGFSATTGFSNTAIGFEALASYTSGTSNSGSNTSIGVGCLGNLITGTNNLCIGVSSGAAYSGAESSNICITSLGIVGESNKIRIGTPGSSSGEQNACFIAGITGVTDSSSSPLGINSSGQLSDLGFGTSNQVLTSNGSGNSPTWQASGTNPASSANACVSLTTTISNVTGDGSFVMPVIFDTIQFDLGSNYNTTTGLFTAPITGQYLACVSLTYSGLALVNNDAELRLIVAGNTFSRSAFNPGAVADTGGNSGYYTYSFSLVVPVVAGQTMAFYTEVGGGTKVVNIQGDFFGNFTFASFTLLST